jgi:hypothetical protein
LNGRPEAAALGPAIQFRIHHVILGSLLNRQISVSIEKIL